MISGLTHWTSKNVKVLNFGIYGLLRLVEYHPKLKGEKYCVVSSGTTVKWSDDISEASDAFEDEKERLKELGLIAQL